MITTQHNTVINSELYKVLARVKERENEVVRWCYAENQMTAIGIGEKTNRYYHAFVVQHPLSESGFEYGYVTIGNYKSKTHWL